MCVCNFLASPATRIVFQACIIYAYMYYKVSYIVYRRLGRIFDKYTWNWMKIVAKDMKINSKNGYTWKYQQFTTQHVISVIILEKMNILTKKGIHLKQKLLYGRNLKNLVGTLIKYYCKFRKTYKSEFWHSWQATQALWNNFPPIFTLSTWKTVLRHFSQSFCNKSWPSSLCCCQKFRNFGENT